MYITLAFNGCSYCRKKIGTRGKSAVGRLRHQLSCSRADIAINLLNWDCLAKRGVSCSRNFQSHPKFFPPATSHLCLSVFSGNCSFLQIIKVVLTCLFYFITNEFTVQRLLHSMFSCYQTSTYVPRYCHTWIREHPAVGLWSVSSDDRNSDKSYDTKLLCTSI